MFTHPFFLRAHTSFMLSSGWTSFPPQVPLGGVGSYFLGLAVFSLEAIQRRTLRSFGIVLALDHWLDAYLHFCTYSTCIIFLSWVYFQLRSIYCLMIHVSYSCFLS